MELIILSLAIYSFRMPSLQLFDKNRILAFLEPDFNDQLSATKRPSAAAPRACDIVATAVGSGRKHRGIWDLVQRGIKVPQLKHINVTVHMRMRSFEFWMWSHMEPTLLMKFSRQSLLSSKSLLKKDRQWQDSLTSQHDIGGKCGMIYWTVVQMLSGVLQHPLLGTIWWPPMQIPGRKTNLLMFWNL